MEKFFISIVFSLDSDGQAIYNGTMLSDAGADIMGDTVFEDSILSDEYRIGYDPISKQWIKVRNIDDMRYSGTRLGDTGVDVMYDVIEWLNVCEWLKPEYEIISVNEVKYA